MRVPLSLHGRHGLPSQGAGRQWHGAVCAPPAAADSALHVEEKFKTKTVNPMMHTSHTRNQQQLGWRHHKVNTEDRGPGGVRQCKPARWTCKARWTLRAQSCM